jgi:hypothetical protein
MFMKNLKVVVVIDQAYPDRIKFFDTPKEAAEEVEKMPLPMTAPLMYTLYSTAVSRTVFDWNLETDTGANLREVTKDKVAKKAKPGRSGAYTDTEVKLIKQAVKDGKTFKEIGVMLYRTTHAVYQKCIALDLVKSKPRKKVKKTLDQRKEQIKANSLRASGSYIPGVPQ